MDLILGLDVGSSVAKAVLFDAAMTEVARASRPLSLLRGDGGRVEFDARAVHDATAGLVRDVAARAGVAPAAIIAVGLSAAMVGGVLTDAAGVPLRAGINWEDARAGPLIDDLFARHPGAMDHIFASSGCVLQQGCTLPVLAHLLRHEPEAVAAAGHFLSLKDYLRLRLTGVAAADPTEAAVAPGSASTRGRSAAMLALFGLAGVAHLLPPVQQSETVAGRITAQAAAATGLAIGTPVAVGAGDVPSSVMGAGGWGAGRATMILGTTAMVGVTHGAPVFAPQGLGLLFTLPGHRWYRAMVNVAGTLNLDWALASLAPDLLAGAGPHAAAGTLAATAPIGAAGVSYLPYLSESGIIAPRVAHFARAGFAGLAPRHTRAHLLRAVFEGVAFSLADLLDVLDAGSATIVLAGGGAQSSLWPQMIADITGRTVEIPEGSEFGARGAALLAAVAVGRFASVASAAACLPRVRATLAPARHTAAAYGMARAIYRTHRDSILGPA